MINLISLPPYSIAILALVITFLQISYYFMRPDKELWILWGAIISLFSALFSLSIVLQFNSDASSSLGTIEKFQYSSVLLMEHAIVCYTFNYLDVKNRYTRILLSVSSLSILLFVWFSGSFISGEITLRTFTFLPFSYNEATLTGYGKIAMLWLVILPFLAMYHWIHHYRTLGAAGKIVMFALLFWMMLGIHDILTVFGLPTVMYLSQYGFFLFSLAIFITTLLDYQNQLRINDQLLSINAARSTFIRSMSHEFRTPLNAVMGFSQIMLADFDSIDNARKKDYLETIYSNGAKLNKHVNSVLMLARLDSEDYIVTTSTTPVYRFIEQLQSEFMDMPHDTSKRIELETTGTRTILRIQEELIRMAALEIIQNALYYSPSISPVAVRINATMDALTIEVTDKGEGIPEEFSKDIFVPFFRVHNPLEGDSEHLGLGLTIALRAAERHGGTVSYTRGNEGGSVFSLQIPQ